jgi:hypothetical protein
MSRRNSRIKALDACVDNNWDVGDVLNSTRWKSPRTIEHIQYRTGKAWVTLSWRGKKNTERVATFPGDVRRIEVVDEV